MAEERHIYDRNILYEEVWAEPMQVVAKRYGVSDVALAKTCRRMGVPVPGRGHWAKLKAGRGETRPPLSSLQPGQPERALIHRVEKPEPPEWLEEVSQAVPIETPEPIVVGATLEDPHRLVLLASRYLAKAHPSGGLVSASGKSCLDIRVAPGSVERALRIFDALIKALGSAGLTVEVAVVQEAEPASPRDYRRPDRAPHPPARVTRVVCDGESIEFCLLEDVRRTEMPRPQSSRKGEFVWEPRAYEYQPTGELMLQITNTSGLGVRSKWQDGKRQRLEDCLGDFIGNLSRVALAFKLQRQAAEQRALAARDAERRRLEESIRQREAEEGREEEERRERQLETEVALWRRAQDIRAYVQAALEILGEADPASESEQFTRGRLRWALEYADSIDPLYRVDGRPEDAT